MKEPDKKQLARRKKAQSRFIFEELEPRVLLSADIPVALADDLFTQDEHFLQASVDANEFPDTASLSDQSQIDTHRALIFVDTDTPDYQQLLDDILRNQDATHHSEIVLLENNRDGIQQITETLSNRTGLDSVHLISHGSAGSVELGSNQLDFDTLISNADLVRSWGDAFAENGDLLVYGCDLAANQEGQNLVDALGRLTGADVAASDDTTGHVSMGGDWELEYTSGTIDARIIVGAEAQRAWTGSLEAVTAAIETEYSRVPLAFEQNVGQTNGSVDFIGRGSGYSVFLTEGEAVLQLGNGNASDVLHMDLVGSNADAQATGLEALPGSSNYLLGDNPDDWYTNVVNYANVSYSDVYAGIDVHYYGNQQRLEYDFVVDAGADTSLIRIDLAGASETRIAENGDLVVVLSDSGTEIRFQAPYSYQDTDSGRQTVDSQYVIHQDGTVGFELGDYDSSKTLVIDPILDYGTFFGSSAADNALDITVDGSGNAYITGYTRGTDFPTPGTPKATTDEDIFVTKLSADGTTQLYTTFLGGSGAEYGYGIEIDAGGNAYITGTTDSTDLPTVNAYQNTLGGTKDAFLIKLDSAGSSVLYSSYFGGATGAALEGGYSIDLDAAGFAYITGTTDASDLPTKNALDSALEGASDAYIAKFDTSLTGAASLIYSTYIGGDGIESGQGIVVDAAGNVHITGSTGSTNLTMVNAYDATANGGNDAYVVKLNSAGNAITYSTYLGGSQADNARGIDINSGGQIYITGNTASADFSTTTGAYNEIYNGGATDIFVARIDPALSGVSSLMYSTFMGGSNADDGYEVAVDSAGLAIVTGDTTSADLPVTSDALDSDLGSVYDGFVAAVDVDGASLAYFTYLGGSFLDRGNAVAVDSADSIYVAGIELSSAGFDGIPSPTYLGPGGSDDGFIVKLSAVTANQAPVNSVPGAQSTPQDTALVFDADNANAISIADDAGTGLIQVTLTATNGTLTLNGGAGLATVGDEITTNTDVSYVQTNPTVAMDAAGGYVAVWQSTAQDGDQEGIFAQRYDADGIAVGSAWQVNTEFTSDQSYPAIAMDAAGNFVITWQSEAQDQASSWGIYAQRYSADGTALGSEFLVNTSSVQNNQNYPDIAMDSSGNFVIVWQGDGAGDSNGVFGQRFNNLGVAQGGEFLINTYITDTQWQASVDMNATGEFVVAWSSETQDGGSWGVYAQIFNADGSVNGSEIATGGQGRTTVVMKDNGEFVIGWKSGDVYARVFDASGSALTGDFAVNTTTTGSQTKFDLALTDDGGFIATWSSPGQDVRMQKFDWSGTAIGAETLVNSTTGGTQVEPTIASNASGDYVILWKNDFAVPNNGIYAQHYYNPDLVFSSGTGENDSTMTLTGTLDDINIALAGLTFTPTPGYAGLATVTINTDDQGNTGSGGALVDNDVVNITVGAGDSPTSIGIADINVDEDAVDTVIDLFATFDDIQDPDNALTYAIIANTNSGLFSATTIDPVAGTLTLDYAADMNGVAVVTLRVTDTAGSYVDTTFTVTVDAVNDSPVNTVPGAQATPQDTSLVFDASNSNQISISDTDAGTNAVEVTLIATNGTVTLGSATSAVGSEFIVNTYTSNVQGDTAVAISTDGSYVATWESFGQDGSDNGVYAQRFAADGTALGTEWKVNTYTTNSQADPGIAMDAAGNFVITWHSYGQDKNNTLGVFAQRYDAAGNPLGAEFQVNSTILSDQRDPSIAMDSVGNFTIIWEGNGPGDSSGIFGQRFDAAGNTIGSEFLVNTETLNNQNRVDIAMNAGGDFVVTWSSDLQDGGGYGVYAQRFNAAGVAQGAEFPVNTTTLDAQWFPDVAIKDNGEFVVTWQSNNQDGSGYGTYGRVFNAAGAALTGEIQLNSTTADSQSFPDVVITDTGGFIAAWGSNNQDGDSSGVYMREFDWAGTALTTETLVNTITSGPQSAPAIAMNNNGALVVIWQGNTPADINGVYGQLYQKTDIIFSVGDGTADTTMTFTGTVADINTVLDGLAFMPDSGFSGASTVTITTDDQGNTGSGGALTDSDVINITVGTGNAAPVLSAANDLTTIEENPVTNDGMLVSDLIAGQVTDADAGALSGIAVVGVDNTNGTWQYSTFGGALWFNIGSPSTSAALLLAADTDTTYVRFVPNADWTGTVSNGLTFHAWDQTSGSSGGVADLTAGTGGTTAFSTATASSSITVIPHVNVAPVFSAGASNGSVSTSIGSGNDIGYRVITQPDGKILYAGYSDNGTDTDFSLVRYNADGTLDTTFSGDGKVITDFGIGNDAAVDMALQADGKILLAGSSWNGTDNDFAVVRYNADGTLDTTFSVDGMLTTDIAAGNDTGSSMTLQADGKILVTGTSSVSGNLDIALVRYNTDGTLDTTFSGDGKLTTALGAGFDYGKSVTVQADGKILVAGYSAGASTDFALVRYNSDGTLDTTFSGDGMLTTDFTGNFDAGQSVTVQADGKILVTGYAADADPTVSYIAVARYNTDGSLDTTFAGDGKVTTAVGTGQDVGYDTVVQADGKILVAGKSQYGVDNTENEIVVVRYNTDGTLDTGFSVDGKMTTNVGDTGYATSLFVQADGNILVAGPSLNGTDYVFTMVRYSSDGTMETNFGAPTYTEDAPAVVLDASVQVFDEELSPGDDFSGATLTLVRNGGASAEDIFSATGNLAALTESGSLVLSGVTIGTVTTNSVGTLVLTFNANATQARVNETLQSIAYANSSDTPPASVQVDWDFSDGNSGAQGTGGALSATGSTTVTVTPVNDAPTTNNVSASGNEDATSIAITLTGSDIDGTVDNYQLNNLPANGTLYTDAGLTLVAATATDYAATAEALTLYFVPNGNWNGVTTFDFVAKDNNGLLDATAATATLTVNAVNDAPTTNNVSAAGNEDDASIAITLTGGDVDGTVDNYQLNNLPANGTLYTDAGLTTVAATATDYAATAEALTLYFVPNGNWNGVTTFDFVAKDNNGLLDATAATATLTVNAVNDVPAATANTVSSPEGTAYNFGVGDFSYSDVEGDSLVSVTFNNLGLGGGTLEHSGGTTVTNGMTLTAAQLATLVYTPVADANGAPLATFDFTVNDAGAGVTAAQMDIDITPVNDAPVVNATASDTGTEDTDQVYTHAEMLVLIGASDVDDADANLNVAISNVVNGSVVLTGGTGGAGTTFTFTPTLNFVGNMTFDYQVSDDESPTPASSAIGTATVTLSAANDTPTDIGLSNSTLDENLNTTGGYSVGTLSTTDPDALDTFTYSIVGGADAGKFTIGGASLDELKLADGLLNYELKSSYQVMVRTTDSSSDTFDKTLTVNINDITGTVSGIAYTDEGVTNLGAGVTINLLVNGVSVESVVTGAGGVYSFTKEASAGDAVAVFIDNDATYKGITVTVSDGSDLSGIQVFANHIVVRSDNGGAISIADMDNALGAYADPDIHYAVVGGNLVANAVGSEIFVPAGHAFTPGGDVSATSIKILGTVNGGANTFTVTGDWNSTLGDWNADTSTVNLTGTGVLLQNTSATPWIHGFNNLSVAAAGQTTTMSSVIWTNQLTTGGGTLTDAASNHALYLQGAGNVFVDGGGALDFDGLHYRANNATQNVVGRDYSGVNKLYFNSVGGPSGGGVYEMQGNIIAGDVHVIVNNDGGSGDVRTSTLNTNNFSLTAANLHVGVDAETDEYAIFNAGSSAVNISGDVNVYATDANGTSMIIAGSSTWTVTGNWTIGDSVFAGTSTIVLDGTGTLDSGNNTFYNLTVGAASQVTTLANDLMVGNVLTIADSTGALTDNGVGYDITVSGSGTPFVNNGAAVTAKKFVYSNGDPVTVTVAGGTYTVSESLQFDGFNTGAGTTFQLNGDLLVNGAGVIQVFPTTSGVAILDTTVLSYNITASNLQVANSLFQAGFIYANNSTIDINGDVSFSSSGNTTINLGGSNWYISGNWANNSTSFTAGTSTVTFDGVSQQITGSTYFNNLTKVESTNDGIDGTLIFDSATTQTVNGTLTLDGLDADDRINLISGTPGTQWNIVLTAPATQAIDYIEVTDSDASGSDASHKPISPVNSVNGGNNVDWFAAVNQAPTVTATASDAGTEDTDVVYTHAQMLTLVGASDVDDIDANLSVAISNVVNGSVALSGGTGGAGTTFTFTPTANFVGGMTFDYQVSDDDSPTPATSAVGTATVALAADNDAPVVNATASDTGTEDTDQVYTHAQLLTLVGASDVDDIDANLSVAISNVVNGSVALSGGTGGAGTTFTFTPTANFVGGMTFDYQVSDDDSPTPATSAVGTATVALAADNDAPVVNATASDTGTEDTDQVYTHAQLLTLVGASDVDDIDANLSVAISNVVNGSVALSGGTGGAGTTFTFTPTANFVGGMTFDYQVSDDDSPTPATSAVGTATVALAADNDAPVVNATASDTGTEDTDQVYTHAQLLTLVGASDVDDIDANLSVAISNVVNGSVALSGGTGGAGTTFTFTPTANFVGGMTFDYQVSDDDSPTPATSAVGTATVTLSAVNDAPTVTATAADTGTEDTDQVYTHAQLLTLVGASDVDDIDANLSVAISNVVNGSVALSGGTGGAGTTFTFTPTANFVGGMTFDYQVSDDESPTPATSAVGTATVTLSAVNDAPTVTATASDTGTEDTDQVYTHAQMLTLVGAADVDDIDANLSVAISNVVNGSVALSGGTGGAGTTFTFTPTANFVGGMTFDYQVSDDESPTPATSAVGTATVALAADNDAPVVNATASDTGTEDTDQVYTHAELLTLIGASDVDDADANLSVAITNVTNGTLVLTGGTGGAGTTFTFTPTLNFAGNMTFDYQVSDDESPTPATSTVGTATVALAAVNDDAVLAAIEGGAVSYLAGSGPVVLTATTTVGDVDNANIGKATIQITGNYVDGEDVLAYSDTPGITATWNSVTGALVLNGPDLIADFETALRSVTYENTSGSPSLLPRTISFTVTNSGGTDSNTVTRDISISVGNNVPVATPNTVTTTEDNAYTFVVGDFTFTDSEGDSLVSVTISNQSLAGGTLEYDSGTTVNNGDTLTALQISTLVYTPAGDANGTPLAMFDFKVNDAGAGTVAAQMDIDVTALNDAPTVTATAADTGTEDTDQVYTHAQMLTLIGASDVDDIDANLSVAISNVVNGSVALSGGTGGAGTTFTFTPTANFVGGMTFDYQVSDDESPTPATSAVGTATVTLSAFNDAPTVTATAADTGTEDTDQVYTHAQMLTLIGAADVDDIDANLSVAISNVVNGSVALSGGTGGAGTTFTFTPTANFVGGMTFDYQVSDDESPTPATSAVGTATVTLSAFNDAPTVTATAADTGTEDTDQVYTHAQMLTLIGAADVDDIDANLSVAISNVVNGSVALSGGTGGAGTTFTFTPTANFVGGMTFDYQVSDDESPTPATSAVGTATVTLSAFNDAPTVTATAADTGTEDTDQVYTHAQMLTLIGAADVDDIDANLSVAISNVVNGSVALSGGTGGAGTTFTFTPTANFVGGMTFDYQVSDDESPTPATSAVGTATVTLSAVNDAPTVTATAADTGTEDTDQVYTHAQMLTLIGAADVDDIDANLSVAISNVVNGSVALSGGTGGAGTTFTFTPTANFVGGMTFDYQVSDDESPTPATSAVGTATVTLSAFNDAPTVTATAADTGTEDTDQVYTHAQMLTLIGAADVDDIDANLSVAISNVVNGSVALSGGTGGAGTTFTFTPTANFVGGMTFDYQVSDDESPTPATSAVGTATVTLSAVNDAPTVTATAADTGTEDTDQVYTHAQMLTLIGAADVDDIDANLSVAISNVVNGSVALSGGTGGAGTTFTFTPTANFVGGMTFDYQVSDDESPTPATSAVGTATVTLSAFNDAPTVTATAADTGTEDTDQVYTHAQMLTLIGAADVDDIDANLSVAISNVVNGSVALSGGTGGAGTTFTFTPTANFVGGMTFDYQVSDDESPTPATSAVGTATVTLSAFNDAPTVTATAADTGTEDTDQVYTHAQMLTLIGAADVDDIDANLSVAISNVVNGSVALSGGTGGAGTTFTFTPTANFVGGMTFDYQVSDDDSPTPETSAVGTATVTLAAVNDGPTMVFPGTVQFGFEDTPLVFSAANGNPISVGDVDAGSADLYIRFLSYNGGITLNGVSGLTFTTGDGVLDTDMEFTGSIADINAALDGLSFTPDAEFSGGTNFQMWVNDLGNTGAGFPQQTTRAALVSIAAVNDAPIVSATAADTGTEDINQAYTHAEMLTLIGASDVDDLDANLTIAISNVINGTVALAGGTGGVGTTFTFTPTANFAGNMTFDYQVSDDDAPTPASSAVGTATVTLSPVNDVPVAVNDTFNSAEDGGGFLPPFWGVLVNDVDVDGDPLTAIMVSGISNGSLTLNANGSYWYWPDPDFYGVDSFTYKVNDGTVDSNIATVTINVSPVNDAPTVTATASDTGTEDTDQVYTHAQMLTLIGAGDVDDIDANLSVAISNVVNGTLALSGGTGGAGTTFTFTSTANFVGNMTFDYQVSDDDLPTPAASAVGTATVTLSAVNDTPTVTATASDTGMEDTDQVYTHAQMLTLIGAGDVDDIAANLSVAISNVVNGTLALSGGTGGAGTTFTFTPSANFVGGMTFDYQVSDDNSPTPATSAVGTATVTLSAANDAPTVNATASDTGTEDTDQMYTHAQMLALIGASDVDDIDANLSVVITNVVNGSVALSGGTGGVGTTFVFTPTADFVGNMTFDYQVQDDNSPTPSVSVVGTATITLSAINDAPIQIVPGQQSTTINAPLIFSSLDGNQISVSDPDGGTGVILEITLNTTNGTLTLADTAGLLFNVGNGSSDAAMTFSGAVSDINTALNGMIFDPGLNYSGSAQITVITDDMGNVGSGGAMNSMDTVNVTVTSETLLPILDDWIEEALSGFEPASMEIPEAYVPVRFAAQVTVDESGTPGEENPEDEIAESTIASTEPNSEAEIYIRTDAEGDKSRPSERISLFNENGSDAQISSSRLVQHAVQMAIANPLAITGSLLPFQANAPVWSLIESMLSQMDSDKSPAATDDQNINIKTATGVTVTLTAGYVSWLLRAGYLSASLLSVAPLWREFDPLPILKTAAGKSRKDKQNSETPAESDSDVDGLFPGSHRNDAEKALL